MVLKDDQDRVRKLIKDTLTLLCKNGLAFDLEFSIEALIGVTLDKQDVFLVNINEQVKSDKARKAEEEAALRGSDANDSADVSGGSTSESDSGSTTRKRRLSGAGQRRKRRKQLLVKHEGQENGGTSEEDNEPQEETASNIHNSSRVKQEEPQEEDDDNVIIIKEEMEDDSWQGQDSFGNFSLPGTSQDQNFPSLSDMSLMPVAAQDASQVWAQSAAYASPGTIGRGRSSTVTGSSQIDPSQENVDSEAEHYLSRIPSTAKKSQPRRRCRVCYSNGIRKDSAFVCSVCPGGVALCFNPCFEQYHTYRNFPILNTGYGDQHKCSDTVIPKYTVPESRLSDSSPFRKISALSRSLSYDICENEDTVPLSQSELDTLL